MRTINITFVWIFAVLAAVTLIAGISGATHQFALSGVCVLMTLMMWIDAQHNDDKIE